MAPTLPDKLHALIIQKARGRSTLLSLSLCCSSFRDVAQSILFRYPIGISRPDQQHSLIDSIVCSPERLGPMVLVFVYMFGKESPYVPGGSYDELSAALRAMSNLKQLFLNDASRYPPTILDGCTFQLVSFQMRRGTNRFLRHFLPTQPALNHLEFDTEVAFGSDGGSPVSYDDWVDEENSDDGSDAASEPASDGPLEIPSNVCPQLESLSAAPHNVMPFFADGRPIKRLEWTDIDRPPAFPPITQFPLEYVKIYTTVLRPWAKSNSFGAAMSSLVSLDLLTVSIVTDQVYSDIIAFVSCLQKLRAIILSSNRRDGWTQSRYQNLFERCRTLERIDILHGLSGMSFKRLLKADGKMNEKWVRADDVHQGVSWIEDKCAYLDYIYDLTDLPVTRIQSILN